MKPCIHVFFYGELAKHIHMNQIEMPLTHSETILDIKEKLAVAFVEWSTYHAPIQQSLNRHLVAEDAIVNIGDEVAFFPPLL